MLPASVLRCCAAARASLRRLLLLILLVLTYNLKNGWSVDVRAGEPKTSNRLKLTRLIKIEKSTKIFLVVRVVVTRSLT